MSSKINGVPRELLERLQSQTELSNDWDEVQALLATPVVERQPIPVVGMLIKGLVHNFKDETLVALNGALVPEASELYRAPPELAELQATIARLTAENERLKSDASPISELEILRAANKQLEEFHDKVVEERLKGGQGEAVAWKTGQCLWESRDAARRHAEPHGLEIEPLHASQPAPVAVVLPSRRAVSPSSREQAMCANTWNACLDEVTRLNTK